MPQSTSPLLADIAIDDPSQDRLERTPFARSLARSILGLQGDDSFVFGLCGPWGSGKTSVLNLVIKELASADEKQRPLIVRFNPWWFSGRHQLLEAFLAQFSASLALPEKGKTATRAAVLFQRLSTGLRPLSFMPFIGEAARAGSEFSKGIGDAAKLYAEAMKTDVHQLRAEIDKALGEMDRRIVVVMDDIDRLSADEIAEVFLILKAVADFPRTIYLLAFDDRVVRRAIRIKLGVNGKTYLEKIVQLQIELPTIGNTAIQQLFLEQLGELLGAEEISEAVKQDFGNIFHDGVKHFLMTPRASKKLLNTLRFSFPSLKGEVYFPDLVGVATLFTFCPAAVHVITSNVEKFVGTERYGQTHKELKTFHEEWLGSIESSIRPHIGGTVRRLFPKCEWALGGPGHSAEFETIWANQLRVCSPSHFEKYFLFAVPTGAISEADWTLIIESLRDPESFERRLMRLTVERGRQVGVSKAKEVLERLGDFAGRSKDAALTATLFTSVFKLGDELIGVGDEEAIGGLMPWDNERRVLRVLVQCISGIAEVDGRLKLIQDTIQGDCGLLTMSELAFYLAHEHGMINSEGEGQPKDEPLLPEKAVRKVLRRAARRIKDATVGDDASKLAMHKSSLRIVRCWCDFGSKRIALKWLRNQERRDSFLIAQLHQASSKIRSHGMSDRVVRESLTVDVHYLQRFFNLKKLKTRCAKLLSDRKEISEADKVVLQLVHNHITDDGKPVKDRWH